MLRIEQMNLWMWANTDRNRPATMSAARPGKPEVKQETAPEPHNEGGGTVRRTRTIKAVGMSVEQLDRFMSQRFTTVNRVENRPQTGQP